MTLLSIRTDSHVMGGMHGQMGHPSPMTLSSASTEFGDPMGLGLGMDGGMDHPQRKRAKIEEISD